MKNDKIKINEKHIKTREGVVKNGFKIRDIRTRMFHSFDPKFLEQSVNEFLEDAIYVKHTQRNLLCDTRNIPQFSDKVKLYNHVVVVEYVEWPF